MSFKNLASIIPAPKAPLEVQDVEIWKPGPGELLVKNDFIALNPVDASIAKVGIPPTEYPAILGASFGGSVVAVGPGVSGWEVADTIAAFNHRSAEKKYGGFQRFVVATVMSASKISGDLEPAVCLMGNLGTVIGLFACKLGFDRPDLKTPPPKNGKKVLIYGGSSSFGSLSVQYLSQAGYSVITTSSPKNQGFVSKLGSAHVIDHTNRADIVTEQLIAEGPYEAVVDSISKPATVGITSKVLAAQGGGNLYALLPAFEPESLPEGVTRFFASWHTFLDEEKHAGLKDWAYHEYLPEGVKSGKTLTVPPRRVSGGLEGLNETLGLLLKGVSCEKLVVCPWASFGDIHNQGSSPKPNNESE